LEKASEVFDDWRTSMEGTVDDLRLEMGHIAKHWERTLVDQPTDMAGVLAPSPVAVEHSPARVPANLPNGHRIEMLHRKGGFGSTLVHPPIKGTFTPVPLFICHVFPKFVLRDLWDIMEINRCGAIWGGSGHGHLPKLHFPSFDGEHPKLCIRWAHSYFDMYSVEPHLWIRVSSMHFTGLAACWFSAQDDQCSLLP
jgi:hypothetical protein